MASNLNIGILGCIYLLQLSMGLVFEIVGPTIDVLQSITNSSSNEISIIFSSRSTGYVVGSILGGGLFHYFIPLISLSCTVLISSLSIGAIGFTHNLYLLYLIFTINGVASGIIDVGTNVWILRLFSNKSGPYFMALFTFFSLGTIIVPLYTGYFLHEIPQHGLVSNVHKPYLVTATFVLASFIGLLILLVQQFRLNHNERNFFARRTEKRETRTPPIDTNLDPLENDDRVREIVHSGEKKLIIIGVLMIMIYSGAEIIYSEYAVPMLTRSKLGIDLKMASKIRSSSNTAHTIGKFIFTIITVFIHPYRLLLLNILLVIFATIMLIVYFNTSLTAIWIFSITFGLASSSLYPSIYPFIESFVRIDYFKGSFFICASGLTAIIYPLLIGTYLTTIPTILLYLHLISMIITLFFTILIKIMGNRLLIIESTHPV